MKKDEADLGSASSLGVNDRLKIGECLQVLEVYYSQRPLRPLLQDFLISFLFGKKITDQFPKACNLWLKDI
jgi:hypothetical protein